MSIEDILRQAHLTELTLSPCLSATPTVTLSEALDLMRTRRVGCLVICDAGHVVGIFTERDVLMKVVGEEVDYGSAIEAFMTPDPVVVRSEAGIWEAIRLMDEGGYRHLPVIDSDGRCRAIVSVNHIIDFLAAHFPTEVYNLPPRTDQTFVAPDGA
jgi:CBS domain-containing protein